MTAGSVASSYGLTLWQPQIVKNFGLADFETGLMNVVPFALACMAMIWWGRRSDGMRERLWHTAIPLFVCAGGLVSCILSASSLTATVMTLEWTPDVRQVNSDGS